MRHLALGTALEQPVPRNIKIDRAVEDGEDKFPLGVRLRSAINNSMYGRRERKLRRFSNEASNWERICVCIVYVGGGFRSRQK